MDDLDDLDALFKSDEKPKSDNIKSVLQKTRTQTSQHDTMSFALVKIWVTMAELFAPMFANLALKNSDQLAPKNNQSDQQT
ncbi:MULTISPECIES: hypothetical protein [unclassified Oleiphilus]|jgi:hypothetical protein|uniref:hypothetical protein n=1 Tax=unclassified Oleiphilus TaxID=2631174 RepID=UPI0007C3ABCF|nr:MULTISPECIES: hypothetical protein [unclassified Oleiphilus]KZY50423.1 hypothetical protein A3732_04630 [Oleiphilus sp. HI0050]KZY78189.1 hypothetical protein A3740_08385 [Oleiphilus sp. HI0068]KZY78862.1 hypothetical protein A3741_07800 [Oleiphilus sp. HI0069]KZY89551.1 hypothetical protein A3743_08060 [Oleiphilus sp. HI0072]KZZ07083.1 hypothetical protein A3749_02350 [Oleiphilus sp. HI0078]KZZ30305.1 hypothetical protein A3752_17235 [Oleiphilus sp. HI0081]